MFTSPVKLVISTIIFTFFIIVINILLIVLIDIDVNILAILTGLVFMFWFIFFTVQIVRYYLWPQARFIQSFSDLNFQTKLFPTREIYSGIYQGIQTKCEIFKGRDRTNGYLYLENNFGFNMAIGVKKSLPNTNNLNVVNPVNPALEYLFINSDDQSQAQKFLDHRDHIQSILKLTKHHNLQIYIEPDQLKIHFAYLQTPKEPREILDLAIKLIK